MFFHTFRLQVLSPSRTSEVSHSHLLSLEISFRPFRSPEVPEILINLSEIGSLKLCKISGIFSAPWRSVKSSTQVGATRPLSSTPNSLLKPIMIGFNYSSISK
nr:hypothetical protein [Zea mays]